MGDAADQTPGAGQGEEEHLTPNDVPVAVVALDVPSTPPTVLGYLTHNDTIAAGAATPGALILALAGGLLAAAVAAGVAMLWMVSGVRTWLVLPPLAQGLAVGAALAWLFRKLNVRSAAAALTVGLVCGLASTAFFHFGLFARNALHVRDDLVKQAQTMAGEKALSNPSSPVARLVANVTDHPFDYFDRSVVYPQSGYHGFVGYMFLRGGAAWAFAFLQAVGVTSLAVALGRRSAVRPACDSCGAWIDAPSNAAVVPADLGDALAQAVQTGDLLGVMQVHVQSKGRSMGSVFTIARLYACSGCGARTVSVVLSGTARPDGSYAPRLLLARRPVSAEMIEVLRYEPANVEADEDLPVHPEPQSLGTSAPGLGETGL